MRIISAVFALVGALPVMPAAVASSLDGSPPVRVAYICSDLRGGSVFRVVEPFAPSCA
ncbi:hypothetical protein [uncultured Rothia sp.]|uniref:hypothetical protein n=1 Tax=uncultured Rothia sp. TaxID=316088 RepID=UPI0025D8AF54|nr:hypothetical protein [uncultured Rothia sp.]